MMRGRSVGLVDYGTGNVRSLTNAFEHLGAQVVMVGDPGATDGCSHLVLPGVGAFGYCANRLAASGLTAVVRDWAVEQRRPFLGICVGMQLLADSSEESPGAAGLGWLGGRVFPLRSQDSIRVPHVGWNTVRFESGFGGIAAGEEYDFYFDHSFAYGQPEHGERIASCRHGETFSAVVARDNIVATQFHPEKSQAAGLRFLEMFLSQ